MKKVFNILLILTLVIPIVVKAEVATCGDTTYVSSTENISLTCGINTDANNFGGFFEGKTIVFDGIEPYLIDSDGVCTTASERDIYKIGYYDVINYELIDGNIYESCAHEIDKYVFSRDTSFITGKTYYRADPYDSNAFLGRQGESMEEDVSPSDYYEVASFAPPLIRHFVEGEEYYTIDEHYATLDETPTAAEFDT